MVALKGKSDIGDQINKKIIAPLAKANKLSDMPGLQRRHQARQRQGDGGPAHQPHRHLREHGPRLLEEPCRRRRHPRRRLRVPDAALRHGERQEQGPVLHARRGQPHHGADHRHSHGQDDRATPPSTTRRAAPARCSSRSPTRPARNVTLYGQEKDAATSASGPDEHDPAQQPDRPHRAGQHTRRSQVQGRRHAQDLRLRRRQSAVLRQALEHRPRSAQRSYDRFKPFGTPPAKQGDYAYLLHIVRSLKSTGKGACILPHGVLFRGNAEADIRRNLVRKGYIKGIIGLPANLFYGTGIPACIIVIDKEDAHARKGIFMIDASTGFMKDGPKNRLRAQDIHKIVDVFNRQLEMPRYSRMVAVEEIEKNDFNLNIPRYIDSQSPRTCRTSKATCRAASPSATWMRWTATGRSAPSCGRRCSSPIGPATSISRSKSAIKSTIYNHPEFTAFITRMNEHFGAWRNPIELASRKIRFLSLCRLFRSMLPAGTR